VLSFIAVLGSFGSCYPNYVRLPRTAYLLPKESEAAIRAFCGQTLTIKSSERTAHITRKRHFKRSSAITLHCNEGS
jgi:hypothetical protein